jgi:hypothetical protein
MQKEFALVHKKLEDHDTRFDDVIGAVAELGGQIKDYHQEMLMLARKVDRMEQWIHEIAEKTGVKLSYE